MYSIDGLCPTGHPLGGYGFSIHLSPAYRDACVASELTQGDVDRVIEIYGQEWLQKTGLSSYFDPENCGVRAKDPAIPSKRTRHSPSHRELRIAWGEWGIEHISVPGNACGLDIDCDPCGNPFREGRSLHPHNVDCWGQVLAILIPFTWLANYVLLEKASENLTQLATIIPNRLAPSAMQTIIIKRDGTIQFVYDDQLAPLLDAGEATIRRASNVEPRGTRWTVDFSPLADPAWQREFGQFSRRGDALAFEQQVVDGLLEVI